MKIGYTSGVFDLFHVGHLRLLQNARKHCDKLIVGVCSDRLAKELKGRKPVIGEKERMEIVSGLKCVSQVILKDQDFDVGIAKKYKAKIIFKGTDWKNSKKWKRNKVLMDIYKQELMFLPYTKSVSTTKLRSRLKC